MTRIIPLMFFMSCLLFTDTRAQSIELNGFAIEQQADQWLITPHYNIELSDAIINAIQNGIEITFVSELRLIAEKNWWPDQTLNKIEQRFEVHYFSLSSQYQLKQLDDSKPTFFTTLDSLLSQLAQNTSFSIKNQPKATAVEGRFYLDQRALPSTMQLPILWDKQWSLESQPLRQLLPATDQP